MSGFSLHNNLIRLQVCHWIYVFKSNHSNSIKYTHLKCNKDLSVRTIKISKRVLQLYLIFQINLEVYEIAEAT